MNSATLEHFILEAKAGSYVGNAAFVAPSRPASHDVAYARAPFRYLDSYFGGTNFSGQETVWLDDEPVWCQTYYGIILRPDLIDASRAGTVIKAALADMYLRHRRFLGGTEFEHEFGVYSDASTGDFRHFTGHETITVDRCVAYELHYHGGLILP